MPCFEQCSKCSTPRSTCTRGSAAAAARRGARLLSNRCTGCAWSTGCSECQLAAWVGMLYALLVLVLQRCCCCCPLPLLLCPLPLLLCPLPLLLCPLPLLLCQLLQHLLCQLLLLLLLTASSTDYSCDSAARCLSAATAAASFADKSCCFCNSGKIAAARVPTTTEQSRCGAIKHCGVAILEQKLYSPL
jgi:hypothetical protein